MATFDDSINCDQRVFFTQRMRWYNFGIFIPLLLSIFTITSNAIAGAWTQKKHGYYFKISTNYFFTKREFNHNGNSVDIFEERPGFENASFRDINFTAYLEYGLTDKLTLVTNLPVKFLESEWDKFIEFTKPDGSTDKISIPESPDTRGFSDLTFSARYSILTKPLVVSLQGGVVLPLGYEKRPDNDGAPLGTGDTDLEGHILFGKSLYPLPLYLTGGVGYRYRSGSLHDEVLYTVEVGYTLKKFLFKVNIDGIRNTTTPPDLAGMTVVTPLPGGGGVVPSVIVGDQHVTKISPSIIYNLNNWFAIQGELLNIIAGKNTTNGTIFSLGFVFSR